MEKCKVTRIFYCRKCFKHTYIEQWNTSKFRHARCSYCKNKDTKFVDTVSYSYGGGKDNVGYISCEKQSEVNIKRIGRESYEKMADADPIMSKRKEAAKKLPWWRNGEKKPLDVSGIKDISKYIRTGEKT